jgi:hypothetical protein
MPFAINTDLLQTLIMHLSAPLKIYSLLSTFSACVTGTHGIIDTSHMLPYVSWTHLW